MLHKDTAEPLCAFLKHQQSCAVGCAIPYLLRYEKGNSSVDFLLEGEGSEMHCISDETHDVVYDRCRSKVWCLRWCECDVFA